MKKLILLTLILLVIPFVSASIDETDIRFIGEQNKELDLKETCFNNNTFCSGSATCNITIFKPDQDILIDGKLMTNQATYHNYTLNTTNTENLGIYETNVVCADGSDNGFDTFYFSITPNGEILSLVQGIVYSILLFILIILTTLIIIGAYKLDGKNKYDFGGKFIQITVNKYIKLGLFFLAYLFLITIFILCEMIAYNFLFLSFIGDVFHVLYIILALFLFPIMLMTIVLFFLKLIADVYTQRLAMRNLPIRKS